MCHSSVRSFKPKISDNEGISDLFIFLLLQMSKVSWYKQRLKALLFKARFADKVEEIKPVRNNPSFYFCSPSVIREPQASNKLLVQSLRVRLSVAFGLAENFGKRT